MRVLKLTYREDVPGVGSVSKTVVVEADLVDLSSDSEHYLYGLYRGLKAQVGESTAKRRRSEEGS